MSRAAAWWLTVTLAATVVAAAPREPAARLRAAGLEEVAVLGGEPPLLASGRLPGGGALRVLLVAGCGPGAETARTALAAASDLARTPRRHGLEVVLCQEAGEPGRAAQVWLDLHPPEERERLLAVLLLTAGAGRPGVILTRAADGPGGRRMPPAWLAHAVLAGARSAGVQLSVGAERWPLLAQLADRFGRPLAAAGVEPFLGAGVPALALTVVGEPGEGAPADWQTAVAAIARRLDGLSGRPRPDDVYLGLAGRIWSRRDLYWVGLTLWVVLLFAGLPGTWRGAAGAERRLRGRRYLPGFAFRMVFLVALLAAPVATVTLLAPAAIATLAPVRRRGAVIFLRLLAQAPVWILAGYLLIAAASGRAEPWPAQIWRLALVCSGIALALNQIGKPAQPAS